MMRLLRLRMAKPPKPTCKHGKRKPFMPFSIVSNPLLLITEGQGAKQAELHTKQGLTLLAACKTLLSAGSAARSVE
jgi:hypothetical protein